MTKEEVINEVEKAKKIVGKSLELDFILDDLRNHIPITNYLSEIVCIGFGCLCDDDGNKITKNIIAVNARQYHLSLLLRSDIEILIKELQETLNEYDNHNISDNYIRYLRIQEIVDTHKKCEEEYNKIKNEKKESIIDDLYLILDATDNAVKIGRSKKPSSRISQLQTSTSHKLELLYKIEGKGYLEKELHKRFADIRLKSEWFKNDGTIIKYFNEELL